MLILRNKTIVKFLLAFLIFFLATVYITFPLIFNLSKLTTGFGDELLIAWIQNHGIYSIFHNPASLFNGNIFYPYQNTIAYSDLFLVSSLISAIPVYVLKEPIVAVNFTFLSSLVMLGFSVFALSYYLSKNFMSSVISGLLIIFSPVVLDKKVHLQILTIYFVPLSIMFFTHFIKTKKSKWLAISMFLFVLQTANSFLPGYFLVFFFLIYLIFLFLKDRKKINLFRKKINLLIIISSFLVILPLVAPYFKVSSQFNFKRDIRDSIHFALQPEDLLVAGVDSRMRNILPQNLLVDKFHNGEIKPGFPGLVFTFLIVLSFVYFFKKKKKEIIEISLIWTGLLGLITGFGPAMHWGRMTIHHPFLIPLPYALFYYVLPGFSGFRNSARWEMLFLLCFAVLISFMLNELLKKLSNNKRLLIYFVLIVSIVWEFNFPMKFYNVPQVKNFPKVYSFLADKKDASIFLPICNWNDKCTGEEFLRVYYSTQGFPQMINGTSGFSPVEWQSKIQKINSEFPSDESLSLIKKTGVKYVVFENDIWRKYSSKDVLNEFKSIAGLRLIKQFDNTYVFKL